MRTRQLLAGGALALGLLAIAPAVHASIVLSEGFGVVLPVGWVATNNSTAGGSTGWFQGNTGVFSAQAGAADSYAAANFNNAPFGGDISNWLITPMLSFQDLTTLTFWTRTVDFPFFPDRLEVRLSTAGASTNVGGTTASVGDFTTLLTTVNAGLTTTDYPNDWSMITATILGLDGQSGRFGFRYFVPDTSVNADYIGIDSVTVNTVPEPGSGLLLALGGAALGIARWRRARRGV